MAKKILAVILAVTVALSAMAISVFADYEIPLFESRDAWKNQTHSIGSMQVTFDIPVYGMYGYLTAGDYMILQLPRDWGGNCTDKSISWTVQVMAQNYALPNIENLATWGTASNMVTPGNTLSSEDVTIKNDDGSVRDQKDNTTVVKVAFGYYGRDWDGYSTLIPQTVGYNTISTIRLIADIDVFDECRVNTNMFKITNNGRDIGAYATSVNAQYYKADGTPVPESITYAKDWNATLANGVSQEDNVYDFVTNEWTNGAEDLNPAYPFTWDHTLQARDEAMKAYNNNSVVELHVPLTKQLNGVATYTLYTNSYDSRYNDSYANLLWWQYDAGRTFVAKYDLNGPTDELVFNVPSDILYDGVYGTFASEFVIFEDILLYNTSLMKNYTEIDRDKVGGNAGSMGELSWDADWTGNNHAKYKGQNINYARTGKAGTGAFVDRATDVISIPASSNGNYANGTKNVLVHKDSTYTVTFQGGARLPYRFQIGAAWDKIAATTDGSADGKDPSNATSFKVTGEALIAAGATEGSTFGVYTNSWGDKADYDACTITIVESYNNGLFTSGADVQATKGIRLVIKSAEDTTGEVVDLEGVTPTDTTTQNTDTDDDETDVGDTETEAPDKEENPKTGVALAVIPMLVAAAAAVVAKKH